MNHNTFPTERSETDSHARPELVKFEDGSVALEFAAPGDEIVLGPGSPHKHGRIFEGSTSMAWITTESGNHYALANGYIINERQNGANYAPAGDLHITIGQQLEAPGFGSTSRVESVLLNVGTRPSVEGSEGRQADGRSPFALVERQVQLLDAQN